MILSAGLLRYGQQNGFAIVKIAGIDPQYQSDGRVLAGVVS
jgi:hypothetical protein